MADKELGTGEITAASGLDGTEKVYLRQGANSREADVDDFVTYIQGLQLETKVSMSSDQAVSGGGAVVLWNTDDRDDGDWHDTGSNTDRITTGANVIDVIAKIKLTALATNGPTFGIIIGRYNSIDVLQEDVGVFQSSNEASTDPDIMVPVFNVRMNVGDFLRVSVESSDSAFNVDSAASYFQVRTAGLMPTISGFSGARVEKTVAQSIPDITDTKVTFDKEIWDTHDYHDNSVNNTRFTIPVDGIYLFTGNIDTAGFSSDHQAQLTLRKNNEGFPGFAGTSEVDKSTSSGSRLLNVTGIAQLVAGDYVELIFFMGSGAARDLDATTATSFGIIKLDGPAFIGGGFMTRDPNIGKLVVVSNSVGQVFASGDNEPFEWDTNDFIDDPLFHDTGVDNSRIHAPWTGRYRFTHKVAVSAITATLDMQMWISLNRALDPSSPPVSFFNDFPRHRIEQTKPITTGSRGMTSFASTIISLTAGDYIQFVNWSFPGHTYAQTQTWLELEYLGS